MMRTSSAHEEGGERVFAVNTECFLGDDDGRVRALLAHEVVTAVVDGRPTFEKVEGTDFELPCELVLLALGFVGPERSPLLADLGVAFSARGNVERDPTSQTDVARRLRLRRHGAGPEPDRVGDRRGTKLRGGGRRLADGPDLAAEHAGALLRRPAAGGRR